MNYIKGFWILASFYSISAFTTPTPTSAPTLTDTELTYKNALNLDWIDPNISPAQDFYTYANGSWQKKNKIPADYSSWGTFNMVNDRVQDIIHHIVVTASQESNAPLGSLTQKVGDFFYSGMDETNINHLGISPIINEFARINDLTATNFIDELAHLHSIGVGAFFCFGSMQDFKNSTLMIGAAMQNGLGLPDRDYYLKDDPKFKKIREVYLDHLKQMFILLNDTPEQAAAAATTIMAIETKLAQASMSQVERRDPYAIYNPMDKVQLNQLMPDFSLAQYLNARGQGDLNQINVAMPQFFKKLNELLKTTPLADIKTYMRWQLLDTYASYLSKPFVDQNFKMVTAISGTEKILPRWKRVVNTENGLLGFAIGKLYVEKYFPPQSKQEVLDILKNIRAVLMEDLSTLSWMSQETRDQAIKKLNTMEERVGYPSKWWDYSKLKIDRGAYVLNVLRGKEFLTNRDLSKIGKPIDRTEWVMTPQTINAYYDPSMNNLNLPAGILQPPFFDPKAPAAVNYGSIGFVMGHEMTHGFDDQGAQFDEHGNLKNWWKPEDLVRFKKATQCIVDQFSSYVVDGDLHVQGKLVVGEATADLGGLMLAFKAFKRSQDYKDAKTINNITPEQQFFLGAAHIWAVNMRPQQERNLVTTDPHPPAKFRVNGTFANFPEFKNSFSIPENSPMVNKNRCVIW
ncbi:MAG: M13 family metallopeptidase [Legionella sp.]|nr:M13 family metallopeptidase [Legionella sp.]